MPLDPKRFKAPYITHQQAWAAAERIRAACWPSGVVPVEIEEVLWRVGLRLQPIPSLKEDGDVDALLRGDLATIVVDSAEYMDERMQNRIRFSIAHELGHYILHADIYRGMVFDTVHQWITFVERLPEDQWRFMELHASEFAGRLLVPWERLKAELDKALKEARRAGFAAWDDSGDAAREYIASSVCRVFGVSSQVIERRLIREKLWPLLTAPGHRLGQASPKK
jgi:hypothetical protein